MKNNPIIPTVFSLNKKEFKERFNKLVKISKRIQIDFMDGKFVPNKSVKMEDIPKLKKYKNDFEAHLMVKNPKAWIKKAKQKNFKRVIFHIEATGSSEEINNLIKYSKNLNLEAFLAINPNTKMKLLMNFLKDNKTNLDGILFLGVIPGKEGQKIHKKVFKRVKKIKKNFPNLITQIDGGINDKTIKGAVKSNVDYVNSGSFVSNSKNPKKQINLLEKYFNKF